MTLSVNNSQIKLKNHQNIASRLYIDTATKHHFLIFMELCDSIHLTQYRKVCKLCKQKLKVTLRVLFLELTIVGLDIFGFKFAQYKQQTIPVLTGAGSLYCCTNRLPHNFETRHGNDQNLLQRRLSEAKIF